MRKLPGLNVDHPERRFYVIRGEGYLDAQWGGWLEELTITPEEGNSSRLATPAIDQATLFGLLKRIRDLGVLLLSANCVQPIRAPESDVTRGVRS